MRYEIPYKLSVFLGTVATAFARLPAWIRLPIALLLLVGGIVLIVARINSDVTGYGGRGIACFALIACLGVILLLVSSPGKDNGYHF